MLLSLLGLAVKWFCCDCALGDTNEGFELSILSVPHIWAIPVASPAMPIDDACPFGIVFVGPLLTPSALFDDVGVVGAAVFSMSSSWSCECCEISSAVGSVRSSSSVALEYPSDASACTGGTSS